MKKVLFPLLVLLISGLFFSCSSIPKTVNEGDTLVVGCISADFTGYNQFMDVDMNTSKMTSIYEITFENHDDMSTFSVKPDKDGYFIIKNLKKDIEYSISAVKIEKHSNSGAYVTVGCKIDRDKRRIFTPLSEKVTNFGTVFFHFDGKANTVYWEYGNYPKTKGYFKSLKEKNESEWFDKKIVDLG